MTLPLKRADTGPTFILATARKPCSSVFSSSSQPGMQAFRTSGSFSLAHTASRLAGSWTSPVIVIAMGTSPKHAWLPPVRTRRGEKEGHLRPIRDAYSHTRNAPRTSSRARFGIGRDRPEWLGRAHHEHRDFPSVCAAAIERGHARRLRRCDDDPAYAGFRRGAGDCRSRDGHYSDE